MIYVDRERKDDLGRPIAPKESWFRRAAKATKKALKEKEKHSAQASIYRDQGVKAALEKLFSSKCAYCESQLSAGFSWEVEHFRPKGAVFEWPDHPGYYWLAYSWANLFPSCTLCNQQRIDRPTWEDPRELPARGKGTRFPLRKESTRAMTPEDNILEEKTLLIDPTYDDPADYLGYDAFGNVFSIEDNPYGVKTIEVFNLQRRRLATARQTRIKKLHHMLVKIDSVPKLSQAQKNQLKGELLETAGESDELYAGMIRYYASRAGFFFPDRSL